MLTRRTIGEACDGSVTERKRRFEGLFAQVEGAGEIARVAPHAGKRLEERRE